MITAEHKEAILDVLAGSFPNDTPKVKGSKDDDLEIFINVDSINKEQLWDLSDVVFGRMTDVDIDLKRSGTGITIHLS